MGCRDELFVLACRSSLVVAFFRLAGRRIIRKRTGSAVFRVFMTGFAPPRGIADRPIALEPEANGVADKGCGEGVAGYDGCESPAFAEQAGAGNRWGRPVAMRFSTSIPSFFSAARRRPSVA